MTPPENTAYPGVKRVTRRIALLAGFVLAICSFDSSEAATLVRGPYLQTGTPTSIIIRWRTDVVANSLVRFGTASSNLLNSVNDSGSTTNHIVNLTNLT